MRLIPGARVIDAWYDGADDGRSVRILLALFVLLWTAFQILSYSSIGLHPDLVEIFAWSRHPSLGYYKHPPLAAWVAAGWFSVFPTAEWSFQLLAMMNSAVALFAVDRIARFYLDGDKRLLVLLFLLMTPFYQFHGQRFSQNQILLSTWPVATYCFLRAFQTRTLTWSVAAGVAAALAMLGKYYSVYLVAGIVTAALVHRRRWDYLWSSAPWISVLAGGIVLAPHVYWLATTGWQPFGYAIAVHGQEGPFVNAQRAVGYVVGALGYVALPVLVLTLVARPHWRVLVRALWPREPDRQMLVVLLVAPLLLPVVSAPVFGIGLTALWTMQAWFLLPIVLLIPDDVIVGRAAAVRLAVGVLIFSVAAVLAAPAVAWIRFSNDGRQARGFYEPVSKELTRVWHAATNRPLRIVSGDMDFADAASFYSADHPDAVPNFRWDAAPWVTAEDRTREGWASICRGDDPNCLAMANQLTANEVRAVRVNYQVVINYLGRSARTARFSFILVPPRR